MLRLGAGVGVVAVLGERERAGEAKSAVGALHLLRVGKLERGQVAAQRRQTRGGGAYVALQFVGELP